MANSLPNPRTARARWPALVAVVLVALGVWARCANFKSVFTPAGQVELIPADSHYYLRFARLQLRAFPSFVRTDPYVNYPTGARICWPPVHALLVAAALAVGGVAQPERAGAWVDPALAAIELAVLAVLALRWLRREQALGAVLLYALVPAAVASGSLGNADHHVHEPFVIALTALVFGRALERRAGPAALAAGALLGLGRLLTPLSFAFVPMVALAAPLAAWARREEGPAYARLALRAGVTCAAMTALGVLAFGWARSFEYEHLTWFHPLFALAMFAGAAGLAGVIGRERRWGWAFPLALAAGAPLIPELMRALGHLGKTDPLLAVVVESKPLLAHPAWAWDFLGVTLLAAPFAIAGALRRVVRDRAVEALPVLIATLALALAAGMQARFAQALAGSLAVLLPLGLPYLLPSGASAGARRVAWGFGALGVVTLLPILRPLPYEPPVKDVARVRPALRWMREHTPPAAEDPYATSSARYGVVSSYLLGHLINLWAERPAVASTFSQAKEHVEGNERAAAVLASEDDEEAFAAARHTGARYVVVTPSEFLIGRPRFNRQRCLLTHLLDQAGMATEQKPATGHFRLVFDSDEQRLRAEGGPYTRIFEVVPGAVLSGEAEPGAPVSARLKLVTRTGRALDYERRGQADARGHFALALAYPTEPTPELRPAPGQDGYDVTVGDKRYTVAVSEPMVRDGRELRVQAKAAAE